MKKLLLFAFLIGSIALTGCGGDDESDTPQTDSETADSAATSETYSNDAISFSYMSDWRIEESDSPFGKVVVLSKTEPGAAIPTNLNIIVQDLSGVDPVPDLARYTELSRNSLSEIVEDLEIVDEGETDLSGEAAYQMKYQGRIANKKETANETFQWWQVWSVLDGKAYIFTFTAGVDQFDDHAGTIEKIVGSFEIK